MSMRWPVGISVGERSVFFIMAPMGDCNPFCSMSQTCPRPTHSLEFPLVVRRSVWMIFWNCGSGWIGGAGERGAARMCNNSYASYVKQNPPHGLAEIRALMSTISSMTIQDDITLRGSLVFRSSLTFHVRRIYYYSSTNSHGQTQPARSKDQRAK